MNHIQFGQLVTLSGIPMVGYRNPIRSGYNRPSDFIRHSDGGVSEPQRRLACTAKDFIRHSDGGVSELCVGLRLAQGRLYQAFRWWGIGTSGATSTGIPSTLSGIPMVGYRNTTAGEVDRVSDFIRHSDGGVSELSCRPAWYCR